jgi:hypothetical protein
MPASRSELVSGSDLGVQNVGWPVTRLPRILALLGALAGAWFLSLLFHSGSAAAAPTGAGVSPPTVSAQVAIHPPTAPVAVAVRPPSVRVAVRPRTVHPVPTPAVRPSIPGPSSSRPVVSRPSGSQRPAVASSASGFASAISHPSTSPVSVGVAHVSSAASWPHRASTVSAAAAESRVAPAAASLTPAMPVAAAVFRSATQAVVQPPRPGMISTVTGFAAPLASIVALAGSTGLTFTIPGVVPLSVPAASGVLDAASAPASSTVQLASPGRTDPDAAWPAPLLDALGWGAGSPAPALVGTFAGNAPVPAAVAAPSLTVATAAPALPGPAAPGPAPAGPDGGSGAVTGQQTSSTAFGAVALVWLARRRTASFSTRRGRTAPRAPRQRATQPPVSPD